MRSRRSPPCTSAGEGCSRGSWRTRRPRSAAAQLAAVIGPGIGPCCYEVGEEVAEPFRARFGGGILRDGKLDLWSATELALREAGAEVTRLDLCTACNPELFFSHRREHGTTGRQGLIAYVT